MVVQMIKTGEETGKLNFMLKTLGAVLQERSGQRGGHAGKPDRAGDDSCFGRGRRRFAHFHSRADLQHHGRNLVLKPTSEVGSG